MCKISVGDLALLVLRGFKRWLIKVKKDEEFHTHKGVIKFNDIIGKSYGCEVTTSMGAKIKVFKPLLSDAVIKMKRPTQIIYPKDVGVILAFTGISSGFKVGEAGIGSGGLTLFLANSVKPDGKVYGYDIREESIKATVKNLKKFKLDDFVEIKKHDVTDGFLETNLDVIILDLATPWLVVPKAYEALKNSGVLVSYSPTIEQTQKTVFELEKNNFSDIKTFECILREILVRENKTRPATLMVGHTGYITFARKGI
ncbi:MAG: tRNA (adenine-N1)-methyltransferase [Candidatus Odinarchaeia archaeon]